MTPLTYEESKSYKAKHLLYIQKKINADDDNKRHHKVTDHCH